MTIQFYKYQGTGNDFVMIDDRDQQFPDDLNLVQTLCDRRFGVGADGLILIREHTTLDFEMVYFNADGSKSLCGNGSRCAVNFARKLGIVDTEAHYLTIDGPYRAKIDDENRVHIQMKDIGDVTQSPDYCFIDNGSPHHIIFSDHNDQEDVYNIGKSVRESPVYAPGGTNVNFVQILGDHHIDVRTYERGVEDETLSCGTGVTASSLAASFKGVESPIQVNTKGGNLSVAFERGEDGIFRNIVLSGPAEFVFQGTFNS